MKPRYVYNRRPGDDQVYAEVMSGIYWSMRPFKSTDYVIDVGAHCGFYACHAAEKTTSVWAFEPEPENFRELGFNVRAFSNIKIFPSAVWSETSFKPLYLSHSSAEHSLVHKRTIMQTMSHCVSLDDVYTENKLDIIKINVEGAELEVLLGAKRLIKDFRPYVVMEVSDDDLFAVEKLLSNTHYTIRKNRILWGIPQ